MVKYVKSAYQRKTKDVYVVQGNYGYGWDDLFEEDTWLDAKQALKEYQENEPQYSHRIITRREKVDSPVTSATEIAGTEENEYDLKDDINAVGDKFAYITEGLYQVDETRAREVISELNVTLDGYIVELANILTENIEASTKPTGKVITAGAKIKAENEGILEVPEGKNVDDLPIKHFKELIDKKGREPIIRALTNLEVWNKNDNKSLSSWAKKMKKSLEGYGEKE